MNEIIIIDTDILIDADRGVEKAILYLENLSMVYVIAISEITEMEIIVGCNNKNELSKAEKYLNQFLVYKINETISDEAVRLLKLYNLSHGLLIADSIIAATSITYGTLFSTKNQKDFKFIEELNLTEY